MVDGEDGALLFPSTGAVTRLTDGKVQLAYRYPATMREFEASNVFRDHDGCLWVGPSGRGIVHIHQGRTDAFSQSDGLSGNIVSDFFEDREGNIWVSTTNGLDRFRELPVTTYSANEGLSGAPRGAVLGAKDGSIWFIADGGLNRLTNGQFTVYRETSARSTADVREISVKGLPSNGLASLFQDSHGRIWVSSLTGFGYLEDDRFFLTAAPGGTVQALTEDITGSLWIVYQDLGLFRLSPIHDVNQIPWAALGPEGPVSTLAPDPLYGGLWLGFSRAGIAYFRDGQVRASYSAADGLGEGRVNQLRSDGQGALWAATEGGLSRLQSGRIATLTRRNGLPCDAVHWTIEDDAQAVWLMMPCGLVRVARSDLEAWAVASDKAGRTIQVTVFDNSDGVQVRGSAGGLTPHVAKSKDGKLWFWNGDGIGMVDPRHLPFNQLPPPVRIEQIIADRKTYAAGAKWRLPRLTRDVEIDYVALSFVDPEKNRYRYKLQGRDRDWVDAGTRRQAFYNDLPPSDYHFHVIAANSDGVWNEAGASFDFSIDPAYYQTTWFYSLLAAAMLGLLAGLYQLRLRYLKHQFNVRLESRVGERTRIARDLHDTMLQSFQGSLMNFHALTYLLQDRPEVLKKLENCIEKARAAVAEGRDAVQGLRSSTVLANDLARAISTFGEGLAGDQPEQTCPEFRVQVEGKSRDLPPLVRDEVYRIACESLRNAFRHAQAKQIEVEIRYAPRQFRLCVADNGKGIDPQVLSAGGRAGHHGLPGIHERAELAGGKLVVRSKLNSGTEIELTIPATIAYRKSSPPPKSPPMTAGEGNG